MAPVADSVRSLHAQSNRAEKIEPSPPGRTDLRDLAAPSSLLTVFGQVTEQDASAGYGSNAVGLSPSSN